MSVHYDKDPVTVVYEDEPFNAGPPPVWLSRHFVTPTALFFSRNHGPVPQIDPALYRLPVTGHVQQTLSLSLGALKHDFTRRELMATLQCAGNRREELQAVAPTPGELPWSIEAISNATWAGAPLREVLLHAGLTEGALHASFTGYDQVERLNTRFGYGSSIPVEKALCDEVLLAYEMNGEPLQPIHGFPLRVIVPGYIGARSVKWLAEIRLQETPSANYFQSRAYRLFSPDVRPDTVKWEEGVMLGELWVNAVICVPHAGQTLPEGEVIVEGYAMGGNDPIARVELSTDGGQQWSQATITDQHDAWTWCFWKGVLTLPPGSHEIIVRAWDTQGVTQPQYVKDVWNFKGYANNAWHRIQVTCR